MKAAGTQAEIKCRLRFRLQTGIRHAVNSPYPDHEVITLYPLQPLFPPVLVAGRMGYLFLLHRHRRSDGRDRRCPGQLPGYYCGENPGGLYSFRYRGQKSYTVTASVRLPRKRSSTIATGTTTVRYISRLKMNMNPYVS